MKELLVVSNAEIRRLIAVKESLQAKTLELLERQVKAQETMSALNINKSQREADSKMKDALIEAKAKAGSIIFYVEELNKAIKKIRGCNNASDIEVKRAMRSIVEWKEEVQKIIKTKVEFKILVEKNGFTDEDDIEKDRVEREVNDLKSEMDAVIQSVESEDITRALYSLDTTPPVRDPVKLPKFSGKDKKTSTPSKKK